MKTLNDTYRFGGYKGLFKSMSNHKLPETNLTKTVVGVLSPGYYPSLTISYVEYGDTQLTIVLTQEETGATHKETLYPRSVNGQLNFLTKYLVRAAGVGEVSPAPHMLGPALLGKTVAARLADSPGGYELTKHDSFYFIGENKFASYLEAQEYIKRKQLKPKTVRVQSFHTPNITK